MLSQSQFDVLAKIQDAIVAVEALGELGFDEVVDVSLPPLKAKLKRLLDLYMVSESVFLAMYAEKMIEKKPLGLS